MNPRQRRGLLLVALALAGAVAVFWSVTAHVSEVQAQVGPMTNVVMLDEDLPAYAPLGPEALAVRQMPQRWVPGRALVEPDAVVGLVATTPLPAGTVLQEQMLVPPPDLEAGQRELAILVDAETGVAGKIGRDSVVDIYATFPANQSEPARATIVVERAQILEVGTPQVTSDETATGAFTEEQVVPVTFSLSVSESLRLAYVQSFAADVSLALRAPLDDRAVEVQQRSYQPLPETGGVGS
ncbi:MAG: Flp pilus assembly protein CpaB [Egibacteraceae bacterium]